MLSIVFLLLPLAVWLFVRLRYLRLRQLAHLPRLPPSLVWGHLKALHSFVQQGPVDRHHGEH